MRRPRQPAGGRPAGRVAAGFPPVRLARAFSGRVTTLKVHEDNALVRAVLETPGDGNVLVVDGGGSLRRALVGGQLGLLAQDNGWAGIIVDGCVRDTEEINACDIGVRALAAHPQKSGKKGAGERNAARPYRRRAGQ
jgi:regulator of ribonuclease activity A